jgi:hypothetical protein
VITVRELLFVRLDEARRDVEIQLGRGYVEHARVATGRADGIAEALEMIGLKIPRWINRPNY